MSKKIIEPDKDSATILQAKNAPEGLQMVHKSKADLFIGFSPNSYLITKHRLFGITPKYVYHDLLNKFGMAIRPDWPELVSILNKGISRFSEREIDTIISHIIHQYGLTHLKVTATAPFGNQQLSMGSRKNLPELNSIIDKALASVTEKEKTAIRNKYLAIKFGQGINKAEVLKWALIFGGAAACILLLLLFWNRKMSREIGKRKKSELAFKQAKDEAEAANRSKSLFWPT